MTDRSHVFDRHDEYDRNIRIAAAVSLALVIAGFLFVKPGPVKPGPVRSDMAVIRLDSITDIIVEPPKKEAPPKPKLPVPDQHGVPMDPGVGIHTWADTGRPVTAPPELRPVPFWRVEKKPVLKFQAPVKYPEMAAQAGITGTVTVEAVVDTLGNVVEPRVIVSAGNQLLDQAALDAAVRFKFTPGYQRDRPVPVLIAIPFKFELQ